MATTSQLLPQALQMIPRIPTNKNLGVSSFQPRASSVNSRVSVSRVHLNHSGAIDSRKRREIIPKAEESSEGEGGETEADVEDVAETVETTEVEEAKPQWKPRTKLGDVIGILNQKAIEVSQKVRPVPEIRTGDIVEIKLGIKVVSHRKVRRARLYYLRDKLPRLSTFK